MGGPEEVFKNCQRAQTLERARSMMDSRKWNLYALK